MDKIEKKSIKKIKKKTIKFSFTLQNLCIKTIKTNYQIKS